MKLAILLVLVLVLVWFAYKYTSESMHSTLYPKRLIKLHYVNWSPLCMEVFPVWNQLKDNLGKQLVLTEVDEDVAKTYYVTTYPSIFMIDQNGKKRKYNGVFNYQSLSNWATSPYYRDALI